MHINFAEKNGKTVLTVTDGADQIHSSTHDSLKDAQKLARQGVRKGWDTVSPEALAAETKAEQAKEKERVEAGKKEAEPKSDAKSAKAEK